MSNTQQSSTRTGLLMFVASFTLGLLIFALFGYLAGVFTPNQGVVDSLTGSPSGWIAVFGVTLMLASPLIGLTIWAFDKAAQSMIKKNKR